eukprot:COSAG01_NODE_45039_length_413_cov_0.834395_1_plen_54_part_10
MAAGPLAAGLAVGLVAALRGQRPLAAMGAECTQSLAIDPSKNVRAPALQCAAQR